MMRNRPRELFDALGTAIALHLELLKAEVRGEVPWSDVKWALRHVERIREEMEWERAKRSGSEAARDEKALAIFGRASGRACNLGSGIGG